MKLQDFFTPEMERELIRVHREMLEEVALYEKLADENKLKDEELEDFFEYHQGLEEKKDATGL